jgi:hypothetical protein
MQLINVNGKQRLAEIHSVINSNTLPVLCCYYLLSYFTVLYQV